MIGKWYSVLFQTQKSTLKWVSFDNYANHIIIIRSFKFKHHLIIIGCHRICLASLTLLTFSCSSQNKRRKEFTCWKIMIDIGAQIIVKVWMNLNSMPCRTFFWVSSTQSLLSLLSPEVFSIFSPSLMFQVSVIAYFCWFMLLPYPATIHRSQLWSILVTLVTLIPVWNNCTRGCTNCAMKDSSFYVYIKSIINICFHSSSTTQNNLPLSGGNQINKSLIWVSWAYSALQN